MHIKALCPECGSTYQVDASLMGKRMRCPNPICRTVFEIRDPGEVTAAPALPSVPAPPLPVQPARSGTVGDMVPILPAEAAAAPPLPVAPRYRPAPLAEPSEPAAEQPSALDDFFAGAAPVATEASPELMAPPEFAAVNESPPVRQDAGDVQRNGGMAPGYPLPEMPPGGAPHHKWWRTLTVLLLVVPLGLAAAWWFLAGSGPGDEEPRFARAEKDYKERNFSEAAARFHALHQDFPESENRQKYQFYAELSDLRDDMLRLHPTWEDTAVSIDKASRFLDFYKSDPLLENYYQDVAEGLYKLVGETAAFAQLNKSRELLDVATKLYAQAKRYRGPDETQARTIEKTLQAVSAELATLEQRERLLASLRQLEGVATAEAFFKARQIAADQSAAGEPEVKEILQRIKAAHRQSLHFDGSWAAEPRTDVVEDEVPTLLILPYLGSMPPATPGSTERVVFGLARGVLHAFDPTSGRIRWAKRIGVDCQSLPTWLPPTALAAEAVMVASSDLGGLLALDARTGGVLWFVPLPEICRGQFALIGQRAYVACRSGMVFEIDTAAGRCLGGYKLDQPLTWQGVTQPGSDLVYLAGDRLCLYALDPVERRCAAVVYTGHAGGAVSCDPVIVPLVAGGGESSKSGARGLLLLCLASGPATTDVVTYALPFIDAEQQPAVLETLAGRMWFPPRHHGGQLTLVTDAGALSVYGVKQPNNLDPDLFAIKHTDLARGPLKSAIAGAQVVYQDGSEFWLQAQQRLHCLAGGIDPKAGWTLDPRQINVEPLGGPLHAAQVHTNRKGSRSLFLVTEAPDNYSCWITAVETHHAALLWQRQLGWMARGQPLVVGNHVLGRDSNGHLLHFDATKLIELPGNGWRISGRPVTEILKTSDEASWLLPTKDGSAVLVVAVHDHEARITRFQDGSFSPVLRFPLEAPAAGTADLVDDSVILPLANGRLCQLQLSGKTVVGKEWRSPQADAQALGHVVAVAPGLFASTNGSRGLTLWRIDGDEWQKVAAATVSGRILSPPAVLPVSGKAGEWNLCVADTERGVTLLSPDGLRVVGHWVMSDAITAGPFVRGKDIGLILGGRRLVLLDRAHKEELRAYTFAADIVGVPELVNGLLIVADLEGQFRAFDPGSKQFVGTGYKLRANVAAAAAPVQFGHDLLLAPLTDGTVLLLPRVWFRPHAPGTRR